MKCKIYTMRHKILTKSSASLTNLPVKLDLPDKKGDSAKQKAIYPQNLPILFITNQVPCRQGYSLDLICFS